MASYLKEKYNDFKTGKSVKIGCLTGFFFITLFVSIILYSETKDKSSLLLLFIFFVIMLISITITYSKKLQISKTDLSIIKIIINFLQQSKNNDKIIISYIIRKFSVYPEDDIKKYCSQYLSDNNDINRDLKYLSYKNTKIRYFLIYTLLDIAADDTILSLNEENFIDFIAGELKIHKITLRSIKNSYFKKGLKEERKIIEEQNRKKLMKQFSRFMLPYEAYRIMGVSPSVTKAQLKKAYRTLAKKYHPDKFAVKSDAEIQKAENKFQEIKEAYDVILKSKKL